MGASPWRARAGVLGVLCAALALRLPWLGAIPTASGDEGNWTWIAYDLYVHRPAQLPPSARFVSMAFAHMIAGSYHLFGVTLASARAVLVVGLVLGLLAAWRLCRAMELPRAGITIAAMLALHPWSVLWSRTVTVPYALSLALGVVGPLAWLDALRVKSPWRLLIASQLLGGAMHFSPLAIVPLGACALWTLCVQRIPWRHVPVALSGMLHVVPMVLAAKGVVGVYEGRQVVFFTNFGQRLWVFARTTLGSLDGEATLRHFTGTQGTLAWELALAGCVIAIIAVASRIRDDLSPTARTLTRFASLYLVVALFGLPLVLAPARPWNLPAIDAERYGFVLLAPFMLALGALSERNARVRQLAAVALVMFACAPTARAAHFFLRGGSPDAGFYTLAGGGGYRGWKVAREREALPVLIRREVDRVRGSAPAQIVVADYAWHPFHFVNAEGGSPTRDVMKFPLEERPGVLHVFVLWSDGLFGPRFTPRDWIDGNDRLRALLRSEVFVGQRRVRVFVQPDGTPLCELWSATRR